jgi:recombination protein RecA
VAPPFKTASVDIMYGEGVSHEGELVDLATEAGIIEKSGAWYSYQDNKIGQGKENVKLLFKNSPELSKEIEDKVRDFYGINKKDNSTKDNKKSKKNKDVIEKEVTEQEV